MSKSKKFKNGDEMRQHIRRMIATGMDASKPVAITTGLVTSSPPDPLEISLDQKLVLTADFLIVPDSLIHYELELHHAHSYTESSESGTVTRITDSALPEEPIMIRRGLQVGDRVLLLRVQGGQKYVVFDRVVMS